MSEGAGAALSATSGRGLLPLCGGVGPPGARVFSSPQLQICGLSSAAVEGLGAVLRSISGVAEVVPKPLTRCELLLQPPRSATKSTGGSTRAVSSLCGGRPSSTATEKRWCSKQWCIDRADRRILARASSLLHASIASRLDARTFSCHVDARACRPPADNDNADRSMRAVPARLTKIS